MNSVVVERPKKNQLEFNMEGVHAIVMNNTNRGTNVETDRLQELRKLFGWDEDTYYGKVLINKEMADIMLTRNIRNRRMLKSSLDKYKTSLIKGDFTLSNDAISFNSKGELVNGQHRLKAISETGISLESLVALGVEQSSEMDRGAKRNIVENIVITGNIPEELTNNNTIKTCKALVNVIKNKQALNTSDLEDFINDNREAIKIAQENNLLMLQGSTRYVFNVNIAAAFLAAVIYYFNNEYDKLDERISQLVHIRTVLTTGIISNDADNDEIIIKLRDVIKDNGNNAYKITSDAKLKYTEYCIHSVCNNLHRKRVLCKSHYYI